MVDVVVPTDLLDRAALLIGDEEPHVLGIVGAPGSGKTTLAEALITALGRRFGDGTPAHVPVDGYHLADVTLASLGLLDRKGAPTTFDAWGLAALLQRIRAPRHVCGEVIYAPGFEREFEQPIAGAVAVGPAVRLVVTEGNYLLLDEPGWAAARAQCDEVWFVEVPEQLRRDRLVARHVRFGKSPDAAARWVDRVDQPNADLVAATRARADLVVTLP